MIDDQTVIEFQDPGFLIIGIDPGDSTGVAAIRNGTLVVPPIQKNPQEAMLAVEVILEHAHQDEVTIACERYVQAMGRVRSHQPTAQQVVGASRAIAMRYHVPFVLQGAAEARAVASNEVLRKLGMLQRGDDVGAPDADDARMAVRHCLLCMAHKHASMFDALMQSIGL